MTIIKFINEIKFIWQSKIMCRFNKHVYMVNNAGINPLTVDLIGISYSECIYCNHFRILHRQIPKSYIENFLKQKRYYELTLNQRSVLFEKHTKKLEMDMNSDGIHPNLDGHQHLLVNHF